MAIITVLAAVAIPTFGRQLETARETGDMELIRSAYNEALTIAMLDAADGVLDATNGGTNGTSLAAPSAAIAATAANGVGTYKVTFSAMEPAMQPTQTKSDWQYINKLLFGQPVAAMTNKSTDVSFKFKMGTDGNPVLDDNGITITTPSS